MLILVLRKIPPNICNYFLLMSSNDSLKNNQYNLLQYYQNINYKKSGILQIFQNRYIHTIIIQYRNVQQDTHTMIRLVIYRLDHMLNNLMIEDHYKLNKFNHIMDKLDKSHHQRCLKKYTDIKNWLLMDHQVLQFKDMINMLLFRYYQHIISMSNDILFVIKQICLTLTFYIFCIIIKI